MESSNTPNEPQDSSSDDSPEGDHQETTSTVRGTHELQADTDDLGKALSTPALEFAKRAAEIGGLSQLKAGAVYNDAIRDAIKVIAKPTAERIAQQHNLGYLSSFTTGAMYNDAIRDALKVIAKPATERIAQQHNLGYLSSFTTGAMYNDAIRNALNGPARQIAEQVAKTHGDAYVSNINTGAMYNDAIRNALSGQAKRAADSIRKSSFAWLENYSRQSLEPGMFAEVAHTLAKDEIESKDSDYKPLTFGNVNQADISTPKEVFERFEMEAKSLRGLLSQMENLSTRFKSLNIVWRGQSNANWPLVSSLYRKVEIQNTDTLKQNPTTGINNSIPTENQVLKAESYLLSQIRDRWRLGSTSGIELLTRMQHRGIPTRLIDATRSPLLAIWFAVSDQSDEDARVFAVAHHSIPAAQDPEAAATQRQLWSTHEPFWLRFDSPTEQFLNAWGTGTRLQELVPPDYDKRILAQNAVFLLDGLPTFTDSLISNFNSFAKSEWTVADIARSMSIILAPADPTDRNTDHDNPLSRVYSFRIPAKLKESFKETLKRTYGLDWEVVYPDIDGIGYYINNNAEWIEDAMN